LVTAVKVVVSVEALAKTSGAVAKTVLGADSLLLKGSSSGSVSGGISNRYCNTVISRSETSV